MFAYKPFTMNSFHGVLSRKPRPYSLKLKFGKARTKTHQGLSVTVRVLNKLYEGGRTVSEAFKKNLPIVFEKLLPKWNYWALPQ